MRRTFCLLTAIVFLTARCASLPILVPASAISADKYADWECPRIIAAWNEITLDLAKTEQEQVGQAVKDAAILTLLLILMGASHGGGGGGSGGGGEPLFGMRHKQYNDDHLAQVKGEHAAIEQAAQTRKCALPAAPVAPLAPPTTPVDAVRVPETHQGRESACPPGPARVADDPIAAFDRAICLHPQRADALYNGKGRIYADQGQYDRAIANYDQAIRLSPNFADAFNNRGLAYRAKGLQDRADVDFAMARQLNPKFSSSPE